MTPPRTTVKTHAAASQPSSKEGQRIEAMQALAHVFASMFEGLLQGYEATIATEPKAA